MTQRSDYIISLDSSWEYLLFSDIFDVSVSAVFCFVETELQQLYWKR